MLGKEASSATELVSLSRFPTPWGSTIHNDVGSLPSVPPRSRSWWKRFRSVRSSLQWAVAYAWMSSVRCRQDCSRAWTNYACLGCAGGWKRFKLGNQRLCSADRPGDFLVHPRLSLDCTHHLVLARVQLDGPGFMLMPDRRIGLLLPCDGPGWRHCIFSAGSF